MIHWSRYWGLTGQALPVITFQDLLNVCGAGQADEFVALSNIQTIEHGKDSKEFERLFEVGLKDGEEFVGDNVGWSCDCEVINLTEKEDGMSADNAVVET